MSGESAGNLTAGSTPGSLSEAAFASQCDIYSARTLLVVDEEEEIVIQSAEPNPRIGGGTSPETWWTGGSNLNPIQRFRSINARRPVDFKAAERV